MSTLSVHCWYVWNYYLTRLKRLLYFLTFHATQDSWKSNQTKGYYTPVCSKICLCLLDLIKWFLFHTSCIAKNWLLKSSDLKILKFFKMRCFFGHGLRAKYEICDLCHRGFRKMSSSNEKDINIYEHLGSRVTKTLTI